MSKQYRKLSFIGLFVFACTTVHAGGASRPPQDRVETTRTAPALADGLVSTPGAWPVIVHSAYGGRIFGFDIDQEGTEGLLSEAQVLDNGHVLAAVEKFDLRTGRIVHIVAVTETADEDFLTLGIVNDNVGLVMHERSGGTRTFGVLMPPNADKFTRPWTPPITSHHIVESLSRNQGSALAAVYAYDNSENFEPVVFSTNVGANTFGTPVVMTDSSFMTGLVPEVAYNTQTNQALLGIQALGNPFIAPTMALVDLGSGATQIFSGVGLGNVNGMAIDSGTNIACTTTEIDFSVQFYDLATQSGFSQFLPGGLSQFHSGADVAVDPVHHLFLVAQPNSSTDPGASSIYVYDEQGTLLESIGGFHFANAGSVVFMHIALNPRQRFGFVDGPDPNVTELQRFTY